MYLLCREDISLTVLGEADGLILGGHAAILKLTNQLAQGLNDLPLALCLLLLRQRLLPNQWCFTAILTWCVAACFSLGLVDTRVNLSCRLYHLFLSLILLLGSVK